MLANLDCDVDAESDYQQLAVVEGEGRTLAKVSLKGVFFARFVSICEAVVVVGTNTFSLAIEESSTFVGRPLFLPVDFFAAFLRIVSVALMFLIRLFVLVNALVALVHVSCYAHMNPLMIYGDLLYRWNRVT